MKPRETARPGTDAPGRGPVGRIFDRLFPPGCVLCGRLLPPGRAPACRLCLHRLPAMAPPLCGRCGGTRLIDLPGLAGCPSCRPWPPGPTRAAAPYRMEGDAARLVRALKFGGWFALARPMGRAMAPPARRLSGPGRSPRLVPVPLSPGRRRERGFNQAERLARALADATGWPVSEELLRRAGGRRQARLGRREREVNVRGRFALRPSEAGPGRGPVLLVDDVVTTGATAGACAATLRAGGRRVLGVVAFARALHAIGEER